MAAMVVGVVTAELQDSWRTALTAGPRAIETVQVLTVALLMALIGAADDLKGLVPRLKLWLTLGVAGLAWWSGFRIESLAAPHLGELPLGVVSLPFTVLWIAGMAHAVNLIDGLDGLAGGMAVIALGAVGVSGWLSGNPLQVLVALTMGGGLLAFLVFNRHPAKIFMGDTGSLAVGATLAMLTVNSSDPTREGATFGLFPLMVLSYPIADTGLSVLRRWLRGVKFSQADKRHIHHRLLGLGRSYGWTISTLYLAGAIAASFGVLYRHGSRDVLLLTLGLTLVGLALLVWVLARWLDYHELLVAGASAFGVVRGARRVLREKIVMRDHAEQVREAESLPALEAVLDHAALAVGLRHIEVTRESARRSLPLPEGAASYWRLDWPLLPAEVEGQDPLVLRMWGERGTGLRPHTAGRVAAVLGPAVEQWLTLPRLHELAGRHAPRRAADGGETAAPAPRMGRRSAERPAQG